MSRRASSVLKSNPCSARLKQMFTESVGFSIWTKSIPSAVRVKEVFGYKPIDLYCFKYLDK